MGRAGGGSRPSGGGGMRHSGGRSGGGSRSSFSSGSRGHSGGGFHTSFTPPRSPSPGRSFSPPPPRPPRGSWGMGGGYRPAPYMGRPRPPRRRSGCGCLTSVVILVFLLILFAAVAGNRSGGIKTEIKTGNIRVSTVQRERLKSTGLVDVGWYTDKLGWIEDAEKLEAGLKQFYKRTGVSPYLYLTDTVDGSTNPTESQMEDFAGNLYDTLFQDEVHFLVVFQEYGDSYNIRYVCGLEARSVMDDEACEILMDYLDAYYYGDYGDEEYFAKAFTDTASRIMTTKVPASVYLYGAAAVIGIVILVVLIYRKATAYKPETATETTETDTLLQNADAQTRSGSDDGNG